MFRRGSRSKPAAAEVDVGIVLNEALKELRLQLAGLREGQLTKEVIDERLKQILKSLQTTAKFVQQKQKDTDSIVAESEVYAGFVEYPFERLMTTSPVTQLLWLTEHSTEAWHFLQVLATHGTSSSRRKIFAESGFLQHAIKDLRNDGETASTVAKCLGALSQVSTSKWTMVRDPDLVACFVGVLSSTLNPPKVKNDILELVAKLAFHFTSEEPQLILFSSPGLAPAVISLVEGQTANTAMRALHNLGLSTKVSLQIAGNRELLDAVVHTQLQRNTRSAMNLLHLLSNNGETHAALIAVGVVQRLNELKTPADDNGYVEMRRTMMLANLVGGNKKTWQELNSIREDALQRILDLLKTVVSAGTDTWPLNVPLRALYSLTLVDENRGILKDAPATLFGALKVATDKKDFTSIALAASTLSNYTYTEAELQSLLGSLPELVPFLERQSGEARNEQTQSALDEITGLLWALTKRQNTATIVSSEEAGKSPLVMISYNWGSQPLAKAVAAALRKMHIDVWLDLDNMNGDVMTAMAEAILQSSAVFVLVSTGYIQSANCRREATFAAERKRKIIPVVCEPRVDLDCWLGILLSGLLRYSLTSVDRVPVDVPDICKKEQLLSVEHATLQSLTITATPLPTDIVQWLHENQCPSLVTFLRERDALDFETLKMLWARKPSVGDVLAICPVKSIKEALLFMNAMDRLFS